MAKIPALPVPDPVSYLVERKYPQHNKPRLMLAQIIEQVDQSPKSTASKGLMALPDQPDHMTAATQEELLSFTEAVAYRQHLITLPPGELNALYIQELQKQHEEADQWQFFNQPDGHADYDFWSRAAHWSLEEAVALTFGKEPRVVHSKHLKQLPFSPFAKKYLELLELTNRAKSFNKLFEPVFPGFYIGWLDQNEIDFPKELRAKVVARGNVIIDWKKFYEESKSLHEESLRRADARFDELKALFEKQEELIVKQDEIIKKAFERIKELETSSTATNTEKDSLSSREKDTLLKMIIGMAVNGYRYDPKLLKSACAKEISDDLMVMGLSVSDDTIRKWLKEAAEFLPSETE